MLKEFIKEYQRVYQISFDDGFIGELERFFALISEPKFHPSKELIDKLNYLSTLGHEPPLVAIVGQFSSGKSSFLNALLGSDILPTGVVPVTAKPTFIKYAPNYMLKILHNDGRDEYKNIDELSAFVDQRHALKDVKNLTIYAPNEILKKISFIDTPGLNSRSDADTYETKMILKEAVALIWISLIDNAARKSELDELNAIPNDLRQNAIALLNQKDKLSDEDIARVLTHANTTYSTHFSSVAAISAKLQRENNPNSGFEAVFEFLDRIANTKEDFIKSTCKNILISSQNQNLHFIEILDEISDIFTKFQDRTSLKFNELKDRYNSKFEIFFEAIKQNAALIAGEINGALKNEKSAYYKEKNGLLSKNSFEKVEYERVSLDRDEILGKLIYNDEKFAKIFKKFRRDLSEFENEILADLQAIFDELKELTLRYKAKYESLRKSDILHSDLLFADIRKFSSEVYSLFISHIETLFLAKFANLGLFFERVFIKVSANYQNAIRLSVNFIAQKCEKSSQDYESDPLAFSLYYPRLSEINERILNELSYYEFESEFTGNSTFITKFINTLEAELATLMDKNQNYINSLKSKYKSDFDELSASLPWS
ncbi:GTP-binding protein (dynamin domain) [Campylobacter vicugnae]|uniref:GTP-binding protein (Dynamin domain) n=1 Tax=Campylobacter vicugnae TaxID=1660076 RepID=A0A1X9T0E2_9BACT|nr:dynamin family protein [Campylobacter sp. RM8964]ARR02002.1 GTP-binding protein (dynamin domain) [Campylobacter sp. RM8964]